MPELHDRPRSLSSVVSSLIFNFLCCMCILYTTTSIILTLRFQISCDFFLSFLANFVQGPFEGLSASGKIFQVVTNHPLLDLKSIRNR